MGRLMANSFVSAKVEIESYLSTKSVELGIKSCVANTGDLLDDGSGGLVPAFEQNSEFLIYAVEQDAMRTIVVGNTAKRIYGSITLNLISPNGQGGAGEARLTDFVNLNLVSTVIGNIRLRSARAIGEYSLDGWSAKIVQVSFELNVSSN